ncbi:hypothetical protein DBR40_24940 [Pedobacter sp. KBW01]|uniref:hypothetical protein n=1 Tax=Pedobacter sp. KBW01 TaxID=2153364 RepID=UPI000F59FEFD|nr:hypothetical protein [Pedobacter sp. KBW01]RQO64759.1 hypothetical protein DBR40_24940 [Pedobacter sp. KBW01]
MTTINITRRKQPIGFINKLTVSTKEGQSASLEAGETITLKTNSPVAEIYVKRFWRVQAIKVDIADNSPSGIVDLELFYDLPLATMYLMLAISAMLVYTAFSGFSSKRYISISLLLILIALVAKTRQASIRVKQLQR